MFTRSIANLSQFTHIETLEIVQDCQFMYVGKIGTDLDNRIVACSTKDQIEQAISRPEIVGVITTSELSERVPAKIGLALSHTPLKCLYTIYRELITAKHFWTDFPTQIHQDARVHPSAIVSPDNVVIGANSYISESAIILERSIISNSCVIGPGTVVGTDAFEVDKTIVPQKILPQQGGVWLGNNVEIQAKCTVVRSTFGGFTKIDDNVKIDCQVHIAHDCSVGSGTLIAACAELSGRVAVGPDAFIGPNSSISNGLNIGKGATVTIGAVATRHIPDNVKVSGNFAIEHNTFLRKLKEQLRRDN